MLNTRWFVLTQHSPLSPQHFPIEWLALVGALGSAVAHLAFKRAMGEGAARAILATRWGTGALVMTLGLAFTSGWGAYQPSWPLFLLVLGSVAGPVVGWLFYLRALPHLAVSVAQPIFNSSVVVAMLLAVLFLGERPNAATVLGAALILVGVQLLQRAGTKRPALAPAARAAHGVGQLAASAALSAPLAPAWHRSLARWLNPMVLPALASAGCLGIASFCFKIGLRELTPVETNWVRTTVPTLVLIGLTLSGELRLGAARPGRPGPLLTPRGVALAIAAGLANDVLGWVARLVALKHASLVVVEPLAATSPLFAALLGAWLLGERLDRRGWLGIAATLAGGILLGGLGR